MAAYQKTVGTREEVWAGTARRTSGKLTKDDLVMSSRGKLVSKKQSEAAKARYPALKAKLCASVQPEAKAPVGILPEAKAPVGILPEAKATEGKEPPKTLVYFGAGWDMRPLGKKDFRSFKRHLYIDALPGLPHYEKGQAGYEDGKDLESFISAITRGLKRYGLTGPPAHRGNQWLFTLKDGRTVEYWVNTTVMDAVADPYLRRQLASAKWLHVAGFWPGQYGLVSARDMPNLYPNLASLREAEVLPAGPADPAGPAGPAGELPTPALGLRSAAEEKKLLASPRKKTKPATAGPRRGLVAVDEIKQPVELSPLAITAWGLVDAYFGFNPGNVDRTTRRRAGALFRSALSLLESRMERHGLTPEQAAGDISPDELESAARRFGSA